MASSYITLPSFESYFLSGKHLSEIRRMKSNLTTYKPQSPQSLRPCAKFNLFEILGGRGLCNGEEQLSRTVEEQASEAAYKEQENADSRPAIPTVESVPEEGFEKELMGLTGGFPGGEKGLKLFLEKNPPPEKASAEKATRTDLEL
ncbi:hypothetical protein L484_001383 [Morus notabilis]|uniref:Uncharacterized protein n=1 Tax=Morus notabilis TaxID=981085 RepID=W9RFV4_9ROSA|nr:NAD(P)H-quinone oxidoreductase subunit S, chloroplastic [Morus notabilis]EXB54045.1 hypothetical protein L484_001383 [Morus notabilis]